MVRWLFGLLILMSTPAFAQIPQWNPAAPYITAGQDEPGYRAWAARASWRPVYVKAFNDYLTAYGVGGVVPTWQLLRTATDWEKCGAEPYEIPPPSAWPNIVAALRYVGAYVTPRIGPVEVVSVYRNPRLNACAGGAPASTHLQLGAIDMVPLKPITREALMWRLCQIHQESGERYWVGLGLYKGIRFHIDAKKFREWGMAGARGGYGCTAVLTEGAMPFPIEPPIATVAPATTDPLAPHN
ncbi:MAG: D-Ala-D-Ala carboxypeptidase family metallohydrolase [Sphingomicrobium sp.]